MAMLVNPSSKKLTPIASSTRKAIALGVTASVMASALPAVHAVDYYREIRGQPLVEHSETVIDFAQAKAEKFQDDSVQYYRWLESYAWRKVHFTEIVKDGLHYPSSISGFETALETAKSERLRRTEGSYAVRRLKNHKPPVPPLGQSYASTNPIKGWEYCKRPPTIEHMFTFCNAQSRKTGSFGKLVKVENLIRTSSYVTAFPKFKACNDKLFRDEVLSSERHPWDNLGLAPFSGMSDLDSDDWDYDHMWSNLLTTNEEALYQYWLAKHEPHNKRVDLQPYRKITEKWQPAYNFWLTKLKRGECSRQLFDSTIDRIKSVVAEGDARKKAETEALAAIEPIVFTPVLECKSLINPVPYDELSLIGKWQADMAATERTIMYLSMEIPLEDEREEYQDFYDIVDRPGDVPTKEELDAHIRSYEERQWTMNAAKLTWKPYAKGEVRIDKAVGFEMKITPKPSIEDLTPPDGYDATYRELSSGIVVPRKIKNQLLLEEKWNLARYSKPWLRATA